MKESVSHIQYLISPWTAPMPSAATVAVVLYTSLSALMHPVLAFIFAGMGMIGMESSGGLMFTLGARALVYRRWEVMAAAIVGALCYVGIVIWTIYTSNETRAIVGSVLVTIITYLGVGLYEYLRESDKQRNQIKAERLEETQSAADAALKIAEAEKIKSQARALELDAQTKQINAQTKQIKASSLSSGQMDTATEHMDGRKVSALNSELLEAVREFCNNNPDCSGRDIAKALKISPTTANKYKAAL